MDDNELVEHVYANGLNSLDEHDLQQWMHLANTADLVAQINVLSVITQRVPDDGLAHSLFAERAIGYASYRFMNGIRSLPVFIAMNPEELTVKILTAAIASCESLLSACTQPGGTASIQAVYHTLGKLHILAGNEASARDALEAANSPEAAELMKQLRFHGLTGARIEVAAHAVVNLDSIASGLGPHTPFVYE
tara:strand:- start:34535 stop:35113 length:579 start_codon:yes stop_codon:yes gene_type:complete